MRGKSFGTVASPVVALGRSASGGPQLLARYVIPGNTQATLTGTVTSPSGTAFARLKAVGAGAPGNNGGQSSPQAGGGGAAYAQKRVDGVGPNVTVSYSVPRGLPADTSPVTAGDASISISGQTVCLAKGGSGSSGGLASGCVGDIRRSGGNGSTATGTSTSNAQPGTNGGAAGIVQTQQNTNNGGAGGGSAGDRDDLLGSGLGADGGDVPLNAPALPGVSYGAGGAGGNGSSGISNAGARGGPGIVVIEFWSA